MRSIADVLRTHERESLKPVAVIDIGSNSVRLVVYDGLTRVPLPLFNEKAMCGLGATIASTGCLDPNGVELALSTLQRFAMLVRAKEVETVFAVATAAVRDATDGPDFVAKIEEITGFEVSVLSGHEEGEFAAHGVIAAIPDANGLVADLGGGSLELAEVYNGSVIATVTLPLGPQRLLDDVVLNSRRTNQDTIDIALSEVRWLERVQGRSLYLVGGAWRALAKLHMERRRYPLHIVHHYGIDRRDAYEFADLIGSLSRKTLKTMQAAPKKRADSLPRAAQVMARLIKATSPREVVFSALGVREGVLFDALPQKSRNFDPLLESCRGQVTRYERHKGFAEQLFQWLDPLFADETHAEKVLRHACCLVSDVAWQIHPDYRAIQARDSVQRLPLLGISHPSRAFMALALWSRYGASIDGAGVEDLLPTLPERSVKRAEALGAAMRLGYFLSTGAPSLLKGTELLVAPPELTLKLSDLGQAAGETIEKRFRAVARLFDLNPRMLEGKN